MPRTFTDTFGVPEASTRVRKENPHEPMKTCGRTFRRGRETTAVNILDGSNYGPFQKFYNTLE